MRELRTQRITLERELKDYRESLPDVEALTHNAEHKSRRAQELEHKAKGAREQASRACRDRDEGIAHRNQVSSKEEDLHKIVQLVEEARSKLGID